MQTPDGRWRVDLVRRPGTDAWWYLIVHADDDTTNEIDWLTIGQVRQVLAEAGVDIGRLEEVPHPPSAAAA
ncbi:hypothetical protein Vau01_105700 [Virgisporangium aurantiacum]|uniref:Uncharacterized protein n=2 Tax=Virgisporangium aurantiacum TaxID=175570 RepID=A0A8J4E6B5_9ACTN|nr:hypothetical protein Vau01_105700 [Virgisporangium aurantiacum]